MDDLREELRAAIIAVLNDDSGVNETVERLLAAGWTKPPVAQQVKFDHGARVEDLMRLLQAAIGKVELTNGRIHTHREVMAAYSHGLEAGLIIAKSPVAQQVESAARFGVEGFGYSTDLFGAIRWAVNHLEAFQNPPQVVDGYVKLSISVPIAAFPPDPTWDRQLDRNQSHG